jgi:hypothetical protein
MGQKIQIRRGKEENLPNLANGELAFTTDTQKVFIGTPTGNVSVGGEASKISVEDGNNHFTGTTVEAVLEELFQFASNGKEDIASVIGNPATNEDTFTQLKTHIQNSKNTLATNLTNKGQSSIGTETLLDLVAKVASVNTGKKFATGQFGALFPNSPQTVLGLAFKPSLVIIYLQTGGDAESFTTISDAYFSQDAYGNKIYASNVYRQTNTPSWYNYRAISLSDANYKIISNGFVFTSLNDLSQSIYKWIAIE